MGTSRFPGAISCGSGAGVGVGCSAGTLPSSSARSAKKQSRQTPRALTGVVNLLYLRPQLLQIAMRVQGLTKHKISDREPIQPASQLKSGRQTSEASLAALLAVYGIARLEWERFIHGTSGASLFFRMMRAIWRRVIIRREKPIAAVPRNTPQIIPTPAA